MRSWVYFWLGITLSLSAFASTEGEARRIEGLLMAPCCWGSTVAEHDSQEAMEIKDGIRQMLAAGKTEGDILHFYEAKYGERILAQPKQSGFNLMVWILPLLGLAFGAFVIWRWMRKPATEKTTEEPELPPSPDVAKYKEKLNQELYGDPRA
jgi:cytochrome c-type biogenesis protein CcmH